MKKFWDNLKGQSPNIQTRQLLWGVLGILVGIAILSTSCAIIQTGDWAGAALNFGTEMAGAVVTYLLLVLVLGTRQEKERLIVNLRSSIKDVALPAAEELRRQGWLTDGSLRNANLKGANLESANLEEAILERANLERANLEVAILRSSNLEGVYLNEAILAGAVLKNAKLRRGILIGAHLEDADLENVDLSEACMFGSHLCGANLSYANLVEAELREADLEWADLSFAQLDGANLQGATYNIHTTWPDGFDPVAAGAILFEGKPEDKE